MVQRSLKRAGLPVLVVNDTRVDRHHGCSRVMLAIEGLLSHHGMQPVAYWVSHQDWRGSPEFAAALDVARLVLINGEGTIHHDRPFGRRLLEIGAAAKERGVPCALVNVGWDTNGADMVAMLQDFVLVAARDNASALAMRAGGKSVRIVPDLSLYYPLPTASPIRRGIGFSDNVDRFKALELERCRQLCNGSNVAIVYSEPGLSGYVRFLRDGISLSRDISSPSTLAGLLALRHRLWQKGGPDTAAFMLQLSSLELLVSGRFHACTLALVAGTPFVTQNSNTAKIANLIDDSGLAAWRKQMPLEPAEVLEAAALGWSPHENTARLDYLAMARSQADQLFADLRNLTE